MSLKEQIQRLKARLDDIVSKQQIGIHADAWNGSFPLWKETYLQLVKDYDEGRYTYTQDPNPTEVKEFHKAVRSELCNMYQRFEVEIRIQLEGDPNSKFMNLIKFYKAILGISNVLDNSESCSELRKEIESKLDKKYHKYLR